MMARIVRIHEYGDASVLKLEDLEVSAPAANEVQISVKAIGLNRAEVMFRNHAYLQEAEFPSRLGYEAAGIVTAVGSDVTEITIGDSVALIHLWILLAGAPTASWPMYRPTWW